MSDTRAARAQAMQEDFDQVLRAIDTYLAANPVNGPVRPRDGLKPLPGTSIPSAVAGAAQRATEALHECGYRIVNAYETYEALVLAGNDKRLYEFNELKRYRQAYQLTAEKAVQDAMTKPPANLAEAYHEGFEDGRNSYAKAINAPLSPSTIDALNKLIAEDLLARRIVSPSTKNGC